MVYMMIECEFVPRQSATAEQLKELGAALQRWYRAEARAAGMGHYIDNHALDHLLRGELPAPWADRLSAMFPQENPPIPDGFDQTNERIRNVFRGSAHKQSVVVRLQGRQAHSRKAIIEGLCRNLPEHLVEDILLDARSWKLID
jgi:hypothetical protein